MSEVKIGMISFAHMHAASYLSHLVRHPDVKMVGIADESKERVEPFLQKYNLPYFSSHEELLAADVDAVVICSENVHHARLTIDAAKAGKHVMCEKPLGLSVEEMKRMIEVCKENGVELMTAFPCRYIPAVIEAKAAVDHGEIGDILSIKGTNRGTIPSGWFIDRSLSGGGAVLDHTVHVMDLMHWFLGSRASEVYAIGGTLFNDVDIDDAGMVHVKFENGVVAVLDPSWSRPKSFPTWGDVTMEITGTKGVIAIDAFAQKNDVYSDERMKTQWSYWGDNMDEYLVKGFVHAIKHGETVPITGEDGLNSASVALAAYTSIREGAPVPVWPA